MSTATITTKARNATLRDLADLLQTQQARKVDVVAPASTVRSEGGVIHVAGADHQISMDGVTATDGVYRPTAIFDEGLSSKLGIPTAYLRRMREERPDLYDANVNGWLHGNADVEADSRSFLLRCFSGDQGGEGVARAFLSDSYKRIDNLDILTATLEAVREVGADIQVTGCDLSERSMRVVINSPGITAAAPVLLQNYRSPFTGQTGREEPMVEAGLVIKNSETGGGAFSIAPHLRVLVCKNGMTMTTDAQRSVHLGGRLDEGIVRWSDETQQRSLELVRSKTVDAIKTFLDVDYLESAIARIEAKCEAPLSESADKAIRKVGKALTFTDEQIAGVLDHFIMGGDVSAGGVMQAVTAYAQVVEDPDTAAMLEESALKVLDLAAAK